MPLPAWVLVLVLVLALALQKTRLPVSARVFGRCLCVCMCVCVYVCVCLWLWCGRSGAIKGPAVGLHCAPPFSHRSCAVLLCTPHQQPRPTLVLLLFACLFHSFVVVFPCRGGDTRYPCAGCPCVHRSCSGQRRSTATRLHRCFEHTRAATSGTTRTRTASGRRTTRSPSRSAGEPTPGLRQVLPQHSIRRAGGPCAW